MGAAPRGKPRHVERYRVGGYREGQAVRDHRRPMGLYPEETPMNDTCPHCLETLDSPWPTVEGLQGRLHADCAMCSAGGPCSHIVTTIAGLRGRAASDALRAAIADALDP